MDKTELQAKTYSFGSPLCTCHLNKRNGTWGPSSPVFLDPLGKRDNYGGSCHWLRIPPSSGKEEEEIITTTVAHSLPPPLLTIMEICPVETGGDGIVGPFYYTPYLLLPLSSAPLFWNRVAKRESRCGCGAVVLLRTVFHPTVPLCFLNHNVTENWWRDKRASGR